MKSISKAIIILIFVVGIYAIILLYSDWNKFIENFLSMKYEYIPIILSIAFGGMFLKVIRQDYLLSQINVKLGIKQNFLIFFASQIMLASPGGLGMAIKSQFIKDNHGETRSRTLTVTIIERYHDLLSMVTIVGILSFFYQIIAIQLFMIILITILIISYIILRVEKFFNLATKILLKLPKLNKLTKNIIDFRDTLQLITKKKVFAVSWILSVVGMLIEAVAINFSFKAFGLDTGFIETTVITYTSILVGALSFIPGGIGTAEASLISLLTSIGISLDVASSVTFFVRLTTIWYATIIGFAVTKFVVFNKNNK